MWVLVLHALNNFAPSPWVIIMIARRDPAIMVTTFCDLSILCAGGIPAHSSLRLWLANRSPHSPADRRRVSKECQTHCTLLKYEINLLERKPKTLRIERLRQLDRAAVKLSCNKLCQSVVNCVKTILPWHLFNRSVLAHKNGKRCIWEQKGCEPEPAEAHGTLSHLLLLIFVNHMFVSIHD